MDKIERETGGNRITFQTGTPADHSKPKPLPSEQGKIYVEPNRPDAGQEAASRSSTCSPEPGKNPPGRQQLPPKPLAAIDPTKQQPTTRPKAVAIVLPASKLVYQAGKSVKVPQAQILTGAVASSPPRVAKASPPARELHPMTGAVASPPPRAPHLASQQPIVTGASSSRALIDSPKGSVSSPRGLTIPPYEAALVSRNFFYFFLFFESLHLASIIASYRSTFVRTQHTSGQGLHSPPPAHQQVS